MRKNLKIRLAEIILAIRNNPVEVLLSIIFCVFGCATMHHTTDTLRIVLSYFPVLFLLSNILNLQTKGSPYRFVYYLSSLFFLPLFWMELTVPSSTFFVSVLSVQLAYLIRGWISDNDGFMQYGIRYLLAGASALLLSGVAWLLALSIFSSIQYIFEIWKGIQREYITYSASIIFLGVMPLLFLMFSKEEKYGGMISNNKLLDALINYVFSSALLIYGIILYLYFLMIAVQWSLPKGDVAYIVISFTSAVFVLKGFQNFLTKRPYDWFYNRASFFVMPPLVMFWIGACYRINQYGFTESRVYLVVVGVILTMVTFLFLSERWGRYLYAACLAVLLLAVVTYIPGTTAKDIEIYSQTARGNYPYPGNVDPSKPHLDYIDGHFSFNIAGYKTMERIGTYGEYTINLTFKSDSVQITNGTQILYNESNAKLLQQQLGKVGLAPDCIPIPKDKYADLLRLEIDSTHTVLFESMTLECDTVLTVRHLGEALLLKR